VRYKLTDGVRVELLSQTWAAFSPISGDTLQLNTEAVAILEVLALGPMDTASVCRVLAHESGTDPAEVREAIQHAWDQLTIAGLIRSDLDRDHNSG
jgi:PqqD family protein of HPr-rel-A system